jgi:hypothetical protein
MIKGKEDAANDDVCGHSVIRKGLVNLMLDGIGNVADQCTGCRTS